MLDIVCPCRVANQNDALHKARRKTMELRIARAQHRVQRYVKRGVSLVDELVAERRREAQRD